uniref:WW domain-containing protein n=1 Tax=Angiostrongylus cantonensis TaxID=6313 RepID=A0A0K0D5M9_ANGCA
LDLSDCSVTDVGSSSSDQGVTSEYNWQGELTSYDLEGLPTEPFVSQFEEFHCGNIDIDPNTPPQWQDVDQYYDELMRLESEEHL